MKKEELVAENALLEKKASNLKASMIHLRDQFTKVLDPAHYEPYQSIPKSMSWEEIFFRIGGLDTDANYTMVVQEKRFLEERRNTQEKRIRELESELREVKK